MHIVIAGAGRVGSELASRMSEAGHDVVVIDRDVHALDILGSEFNGATVLGEAFDVGALREASIEDADAFLAVTSSDNVNLMATEVVRRVFKTGRAIARLFDPARAESYEALGIDFVAGTKLIANVFYEQVIEETFEYHVPFPRGDVEIVQFRVNSSAEGMSYTDLEVRNKLRVAAVHRDGKTIIPGRRFALAENDLVVAAARDGVQSRIDLYVEGMPS
jgi:trk system potassium uptake protein TrkA